MALDLKHLCVFIRIGGWNITLNNGDVYASGRDNGSRRGGQELGIELVIWNGHGTVENLAREVFITAYCRPRGGWRRFGKIREGESTGYGVKYVDPSSIGRGLIMDGSDKLSEEVAICGWAR